MNGVHGQDAEACTLVALTDLQSGWGVIAILPPTFPRLSVKAVHVFGLQRGTVRKIRSLEPQEMAHLVKQLLSKHKYLWGLPAGHAAKSPSSRFSKLLP